MVWGGMILLKFITPIFSSDYFLDQVGFPKKDFGIDRSAFKRPGQKHLLSLSGTESLPLIPIVQFAPGHKMRR